MGKFNFISSMRSLDIEGLGSFRNYEFTTDDEAIAERLRKVRGVSEVRREADTISPLPDAPAHVAESVEKMIEQKEANAPVVHSGMRGSTTKDKSKKEKK